MKIKSNFAYFLVPLALLIAFIPLYVSYSNGYAQREAARLDQEKQAKEQKIEEDNHLRAKAIEQANVNAERRKKEREDREARERQRSEAMDAAIQERDKAQIEGGRARERVGNLQRDVQAVQDEIKAVQAEEAKLREEKTFLEKYAQQTVADQSSLTAVLQKIADADAAAAAAARAAAAAKKS